MAEWKECLLGDFVIFQRGHDLPKTKMIGSKYPVAGSNGIIGYHDEFTTKAPAITIGRSGNVGTPYIYYEPIWAHNTTLYIKEYIDAVPDYVFYFLKTLDLSSYAGGSAVPTLNRNHIHTLPIRVPDRETQKKIANILILFDKKIEVNNKINRNLEEQLTAVYNEWFGMYRPYNIGIGGEPNYELEAGWKIVDIYSLSNIIYGAPFASKLFNTEGDGIPIVRIRDLKNQELVTYTSEKHPKGYLIKRGDIVVGMDGEFKPYIWGNDEAWLNQRVCVFENIREKGKAFLYCTIKPLLHSVEATELATTVIHIGKKDFDEFRVVLPPEELLVKFEAISMDMYDKIIECQVESRRLAKLRDALLPKLMSGELDVSDIDI